MNRRDFLQGLGGISLIKETKALDKSAATPPEQDINEFEGGFTRANLELVGCPRSWSSVQEGFHPLPPERVVILSGKHRQQCLGGSPGLKAQSWDYFERTWCRGKPYSNEKFDLILGLMDFLTTFYHRPGDFEQWARRLVSREALGSTGIGKGFGILHDFQPAEKSMRIINPPVDWWLFLYPEGIDWDSPDEEPVYFMVAPVFSRRRPRHYLQVLALMSQIIMNLSGRGDHDLASWEPRLAQMDRITAARTFNLAVARKLAEVKNEL
jgi:hypothetical protein